MDPLALVLVSVGIMYVVAIVVPVAIVIDMRNSHVKHMKKMNQLPESKPTKIELDLM